MKAMSKLISEGRHADEIMQRPDDRVAADAAHTGARPYDSF
jgi:hypothetical protein